MFSVILYLGMKQTYLLLTVRVLDFTNFVLVYDKSITSQHLCVSSMLKFPFLLILLYRPCKKQNLE